MPTKNKKGTKPDTWSADSRIRGTVLLERQPFFRREELQETLFRLKRLLFDVSDIETLFIRSQDLNGINIEIKEFLGIQRQKFKYRGQGIMPEPALERLTSLSDKITLIVEGNVERNNKTDVNHKELVEISNRCLVDTYALWID